MDDPDSLSRDPDRLPDSTDPSGPCPRCGRPSNFDVQGNAPITFESGTYIVNTRGERERIAQEQISVLECNYCRQGLVVVEEKHVGGVRGGRSGAITWRGIHWWPTPGAGQLGPDISTKVASAYGEGVRCLSVGAPNGAVAMFRTALTYMVEEHGSEAARSKGDLNDKIKQMVKDGGPLGALGDWATHVRLYGNAGAHPDKFGDVSLSEAEDVARLVHTMIELLYVLPANIAARQAARRS